MPDRFDVSVLGQDESSEIFQLLNRCPCIDPLRFRDGEYLVREDEEGKDLFVVVKGALTVERPALVPHGPPAILASFMCDPDHVTIVGEMAYFGAERRTASVRSSGATYALRLKPEHIDVIMEGFPLLTRVICQQFTKRLQEANDRIRDFQKKFALAPDKRMVAAGEVLFMPGDAATVLHQLAVGSVQLERDGVVETLEPENLPMGFLEPLPFFKRQLHTAKATVLSDSFLLFVDREHLEPLVRCYPQLVTKMLEV